MDAEKIIKRILNICEQKNLKPTIACTESGAGKDLVANLRKGIIPSVEKVARLAAYLGVTTSELLGETLPVSKSDTVPHDKPSARYSPDTEEALDMYVRLDEADRGEIRGEMKHMLKAEKYSDQGNKLA